MVIKVTARGEVFDYVCLQTQRYNTKYTSMILRNPRPASTLLFFFLTFAFTAVAAQPLRRIQLLDREDQSPISGLHFLYGDQTGISDEGGVISFRMDGAEPMQLSHVNYGSWKWDAATLAQIATEGQYFREKWILDLQPVTVIALRESGRPEGAFKLDHTDRLEHDGAAVLRQFAGISGIRKGGNYGFDPVFRGFKYDRLNIIFNGAQSATAACPNRMDPPTSQMAPNMMERVEILKGPHALRYGNGFGGTVHFIPTPLRFSEDPEIYGRVSSEYQGNGNLFRSEGQIGLSGNRYDLGLFGSWSGGADYKDGDSRTVQADFRRSSFGMNLGLKLSPDQQWRISTNYNRAGNADFPALPMDLRKDETWMISTRHQMTLHRTYFRSWNTTLFGSFVDHRMDNLLKKLDPRMLNASTEARTSNFGGRTEGTWYFPAGNLYAGLDFKAETARGTRTREFLMGPNAGNLFTDDVWQNGRIWKTALFGEYHHQYRSMRLTLSGRLEINDAIIQDPSDEFSRVHSDVHTTQVNPGLSLGIVRMFGSRFRSGIWLGRVQRSGDLTEKYINFFPVGKDPYEMVGNPGLSPEVNNQADWTFHFTTGRSTLELDLFVSYLQDYISSRIDTALTPRMPSSPGVRRFMNIEEAWKAGFEWNWFQEIGWGLHHQMGIAFTYAQDLERNEPLPEIAPFDFRYMLAGRYMDGRLQPEITFRQVLEQTRISQEFGETATPSFTRVDLKITSQLTQRIRISTGVNNLFNAAYYEHLSRPVRESGIPIYEPGRNLFASFYVIF